MRSGDGLRALDLFCGAGGSSCGARQADVEIVGGVDLWPLATRTFALNNPKAKVFTANLVELDPKDVLRAVGRVDLLLASPECTHHSVAKGAKPRDEASKQLAFQVVRFARVLKPRWIVVENVIQMQRWPSFAVWHDALEELGYHIKTLTLDAHQFAVPQHRRRLFVICDRLGEPAEPRPYCKSNATVQSILGDSNGDGTPRVFRRLESGQQAEATIQRAGRAFDALGRKRPFLMVYYGSDGAGGWQTLDRPLRTITTLDRFALVKPNRHGHEMRMLGEWNKSNSNPHREMVV